MKSDILLPNLPTGAQRRRQRRRRVLRRGALVAIGIMAFTALMVRTGF